jgi:peptidylprolyl isomerase
MIAFAACGGDSGPDGNAPGIPKLTGEIKETASGLRYIDEVAGDGVAPQEGQVVVAHYTGWLTDGTKFDSSRDKDQPYAFRIGLGAVIAGWDEGLATMKAGGKRRLIVPPDLAYGDAARPGIPPGSTLIFDVELLEVQPN